LVHHTPPHLPHLPINGRLCRCFHIIRAALAAFVLDQDPASPQTFNWIFLSCFYLYTCTSINPITSPPTWPLSQAIPSARQRVRTGTQLTVDPPQSTKPARRLAKATVQMSCLRWSLLHACVHTLAARSQASRMLRKVRIRTRSGPYAVNILHSISRS
jgi:hypothetical protein